MSFVLQVLDFEFEGENTLVTGHLKSGQIRGTECVSLPLTDGTSFESTITAMELGRAHGWWPIKGASYVQLELLGSPKGRIVKVPFSATGTKLAPATKHEVMDCSHLLEDPVFWATHYYHSLGTEEIDAEDMVHRYFGVSVEQVSLFYSRHLSPTGPNATQTKISLPLASGYVLGLHYATESEYQERYFVTHSKWPSDLIAGYISAHQALPAFRWAEICRVQECLAAKSSNRIHRECSLLLLFPSVVLTGDDDLDYVRTKLTQSWQALHVIDVRDVDALVSQMISVNIDGSAVDSEQLRSELASTWQAMGVSDPEAVEKRIAEIIRDSRVHWWEHPELGWVTDARHSLRNPKSDMCEFEPEKFQRLSEFFAHLNNSFDMR